MKKVIIKKQDSSEKDYLILLEKIKKDILQTQLRAAVSVTQELTLLYWRIGKDLSESFKKKGWGSKVVENLARDLKKSFPDATGYSPRNLNYMKKFSETYSDLNFATAVAKLPWGHNLTLLEKLKSNRQRLWYADQAIENGWSRSSLALWIESGLYARQGKAITNFKEMLPQPYSDLAEQTLKDPYNFDFLTIDRKAREHEIESGLMAHIQKFLLELGQGFAFIGRQYHLEAGNKDLYIDMLFYHITLRCFVVIELKAEEFDARDLGQVNVYLSAVDSQLKQSGDQPTIGLLLCRSKDNVYAEYALRDINKPIGIASYTTKLVESLPKEFKGKLPTIKEIEAELSKPEVLNQEILLKKIAAKKNIKKS